MNPVKLEQFVKHPDEEVQVCVDFGRWLRSGETLTGTPTATVAPAGLTASGVAVNSAAFTDKNDVTVVAANEGVKLTLAGGEAGETYDVVIKATNSNGVDKPAATLPVVVTGKDGL